MLQKVVSLTDNKDNSFQIYEGTKIIIKNILEKENDNKNQQKIDKDYLESIDRKVLEILAGSLVL